MLLNTYTSKFHFVVIIYFIFSFIFRECMNIFKFTTIIFAEEIKELEKKKITAIPWNVKGKDLSKLLRNIIVNLIFILEQTCGYIKK